MNVSDCLTPERETHLLFRISIRLNVLQQSCLATNFNRALKRRRQDSKHLIKRSQTEFVSLMYLDKCVPECNRLGCLLAMDKDAL